MNTSYSRGIKKYSKLQQDSHKRKGGTHDFGDATATLKLITGELASLILGLKVLYVLGAAEDGAVQGQDFRSLQELDGIEQCESSLSFSGLLLSLLLSIIRRAAGLFLFTDMIEAQRGTELLERRALGGIAAADARHEMGSQYHLRIDLPHSHAVDDRDPLRSEGASMKRRFSF